MACTSKDLQKLTAAAKDEIGESSANILESVQTVKGILAEKYPTLRFPPDIDEIVERSLRIRKFDCAQAATQVHLFFEYLFECRSMHKEMYFLPSTQKEYFFDSLGYAVLKNRDSKGRMLLLLRMERISSTYEVDKDLATFAMVLDEMTRYSVDTQRLGVVIVCDMTGFNFAHAKQFTFSRMKAAVKPMQGSVPVNIERLHLVRNPYIFTVMFALMKLFMDEKLKNRVRMKKKLDQTSVVKRIHNIHCHGNDFTELYKEVSPDILPEFMGGKVADNDYADLEFNRSFFAKDDYYKELLRHGYFATENSEN